MRRLLSVLALAFAALVRLTAAAPASGSASALPDGLYAEFTTPHGAIVVELFHRQAPMTVASFVGRAEGTLAPREGKPFFSGLRWYRVVPGFVLQSGDPVRSAAAPGAELDEAAEQAGHSLPFPDEIAPGLHHAAAGTLSMANGGPDTNSSEFFLTLRDTHRLNYLHSVFGRTVRGGELLAQVKQDEPFSLRIRRIGAEAQAFDASEATFAARVAAAKEYTGTAEPGEGAHFDDPDKLLPADVPRAKNFNFKLANFERFTGRRIAVRVFKEFRPFREGQKIGGYQRELAEKLGVAQDGVLASYFADRDQWMIWVGEARLQEFMGRTGRNEDFLAGDVLARRKDEFIAAARAAGAKFAAAAVAEGRTVSDAQRLKLVVDEVIDGLIFLHEPKAP